MYSEPSRTTKMELFGEIINDFYLLTIFPKSSILDDQLGSEYVSGIFILPQTKKFAIALIVKSSNHLNCRNDFRSQLFKVGYFLFNTHKYFNMEVQIL